MKTIVMTFAHLSWQKGSVAQVISFVREWRRANGSARFVLISQYPELDMPLGRELGIEVAGHNSGIHTSPNIQNLRWLMSLWLAIWVRWLTNLGVPKAYILTNTVVRAFLEADLVADLSGDSFRDRPGGFSPAHNALLFAVRRLGKPIAIISQSLGPFHKINRGLTIRMLNNVACLYIREKSTISLLEQMGCKDSHIILAPDVAFALPLPPTEYLNKLWKQAVIGTDEEVPWVAISMNCLMLDFTANSEAYIGQMSRLATHIHSFYGANILLVPHVIHDVSLGHDDVVPCRELAQALEYPKWIRVLEKDYSPIELKGIISRCEALVASRMHAGIAGLSSGVPTVLLSWSHKYRALMTELELERFTWETDGGTVDELINIFDDLWEQKVEIKAQLESYTEKAVLRIRETMVQISKNTGLTPSGNNQIQEHRKHNQTNELAR